MATDVLVQLTLYPAVLSLAFSARVSHTRALTLTDNDAASAIGGHESTRRQQTPAAGSVDGNAARDGVGEAADEERAMPSVTDRAYGGGGGVNGASVDRQGAASDDGVGAVIRQWMAVLGMRGASAPASWHWGWSGAVEKQSQPQPSLPSHAAVRARADGLQEPLLPVGEEGRQGVDGREGAQGRASADIEGGDGGWEIEIEGGGVEGASAGTRSERECRQQRIHVHTHVHTPASEGEGHGRECTEVKGRDGPRWEARVMSDDGRVWLLLIAMASVVWFLWCLSGVTHTHTHSCTRTYTHSFFLSIHKYTRRHTYTYTHTHTHTLTHSHGHHISQSHACTHLHTHTHTNHPPHTHTNTHALNTHRYGASWRQVASNAD